MACGEQRNGRRVRRNAWEKWVGGGGIAQIYVTEIGMGAKKIAGAIGGNTIGLKLHEN